MMRLFKQRRGDGRVEQHWADAAAWDTAGAEAASLLADLIRTDTTNPPGNETAAAQLAADWLQARGIDGQLVGDTAERLSYVARLEGTRPGPTLLLMAHTDVVPAEPAQWTVPPFGGEIRDGYVWGRGAVDDKNLVAAEAVALAHLAAAGGDFAGTIVLVAVSDEEDGAHSGARWLVRNRPDLVRCDYVLNEGGGEFIEAAGQRTYLLSTGEKGTAQFKLVFHGESGHASVPLLAGNAVAEMAAAITALVAYQPRLHFDFVPGELIERVVGDARLRARLLDSRAARAALAELRTVDAAVAQLIAPLYSLTLAPTIVRAGGEAVNVFPARAEVSVDCRILADQDEADVRAEVEAALEGRHDWDLEWLGVTHGNFSAADTALSRAIATVIDEMVPGSSVAPVHCAGFTDSNWFRGAFPDVVAYGFSPFVSEDYFAVTGRYHNKDERIAIRDLGFAVAFIERVVHELLP
jgi:acetylornithine deacetylase/succinyl-diaminopimelate desuccinylase-like protein